MIPQHVKYKVCLGIFLLGLRELVQDSLSRCTLIRRRDYFSRKSSHGAKMYEACRSTWQRLSVTRNSGWNPRERDDCERRSWISWRFLTRIIAVTISSLSRSHENSIDEVTNIISELRTWFAHTSHTKPRVFHKLQIAAIFSCFIPFLFTFFQIIVSAFNIINCTTFIVEMLACIICLRRRLWENAIRWVYGCIFYSKSDIAGILFPFETTCLQQ